MRKYSLFVCVGLALAFVGCSQSSREAVPAKNPSAEAPKGVAGGTVTNADGSTTTTEEAAGVAEAAPSME